VIWKRCICRLFNAWGQRRVTSRPTRRVPELDSINGHVPGRRSSLLCVSPLVLEWDSDRPTLPLCSSVHVSLFRIQRLWKRILKETKKHETWVNLKAEVGGWLGPTLQFLFSSHSPLIILTILTFKILNAQRNEQKKKTAKEILISRRNRP